MYCYFAFAFVFVFVFTIILSIFQKTIIISEDKIFPHKLCQVINVFAQPQKKRVKEGSDNGTNIVRILFLFDFL